MYDTHGLGEFQSQPLEQLAPVSPRHRLIQAENALPVLRKKWLYIGRGLVRRQDPFIAVQDVLGHKAELLIERLAQGRGVQANTADALALKKFQSMTHERLADALATIASIDQDHGNPGNRTKDTRGQ